MSLLLRSAADQITGSARQDLERETQPGAIPSSFTAGWAGTDLKRQAHDGGVGRGEKQCR